MRPSGHKPIRKEAKRMSAKKQQERKKFWIRLICILMVVLLAGSTVLAALGIF